VKLPLLPLALVAVVVAGCGGEKTRRAPSVPVTVATVEMREMPHELEATGTVEAEQSVQVLAQVGGIIDRIAFREGDPVRAGQLLFQLDARPFRATLDQARAVLARDRAQAENARREAARAQALREQGLIAAGEQEAKQASAEAMAATLRADSAAVANAALRLQYTTIRAPISGRTGHVGVHVGDLVKEGDSGNPLVTINQMQPVRVRFTVPQNALPSVLRSRGRGSALAVTALATDDSVAHVGRLVFVDNTVDVATGTLLLKGEFANRGETLWPGEFVRVRLVLASDPAAVVVPSVAVTAGPTGPYVYVMGADSTVSVRPVQVLRTREDLSVIAHGVKPGEVVVTDGQIRLGPGSRVVLRQPRGAQAPGGAGGNAAAAPAGTPAAAAGGAR
jgi:multidrug efflux system membrane fusion protein